MSRHTQTSTPPQRTARRLGIVAQALILGTLLCWALLRLTMMSGADRIFRYEGF